MGLGGQTPPQPLRKKAIGTAQIEHFMHLSQVQALKGNLSNILMIDGIALDELPRVEMVAHPLIGLDQIIHRVKLILRHGPCPCPPVQQPVIIDVL